LGLAVIQCYQCVGVRLEIAGFTWHKMKFVFFVSVIAGGYTGTCQISGGKQYDVRQFGKWKSPNTLEKFLEVFMQFGRYMLYFHSPYDSISLSISPLL
jgi:hypothetical protein